MSIYRVARPMVVDAVQCTEAKTIATDLGFINVKHGEWVVCGEGGERYVVGDEFFRRTFVAVSNNSSGSEADLPKRKSFAPQLPQKKPSVPLQANFHRDRIRTTLRRVCRRRQRLSSGN